MKVFSNDSAKTRRGLGSVRASNKRSAATAFDRTHTQDVRSRHHPQRLESCVGVAGNFDSFRVDIGNNSQSPRVTQKSCHTNRSSGRDRSPPPNNRMERTRNQRAFYLSWFVRAAHAER